MRFIIFVLFFSISFLYAKYDFKLYKMNNGSYDIANPTILIVGGIHGNEPGSYFAPAVFASHYKITKGQVYIIPMLNKKSIQKNARGYYGDMNRKFKHIKKMTQILKK